MNEPIMTDMRSEYSKSLIQVGHDNPNVVVLGADTTDSLKISGFEKQFPARFFNVGIAEANLVTVSAGLAASGKISLQVLMQYFYLEGQLIKFETTLHILHLLEKKD